VKPGYEIAALAIVALFVTVRARAAREERPAVVLARLGVLAVASLLAEGSMVRLYGFYHYDPGWSLFVDRVPLGIGLIWPVVIHSAWDLARSLRPGGARGAVALVGAGIVLGDAALIEPIAVASGLWRWTEPGIFEVPPIGVLGWAYWAGLCIAVLEHTRAGGAPTPPRLARSSALLLLVALPGTHLALLASWWGALRWLHGQLPAAGALAVAWCASATLAGLALARGTRRRIPLEHMLLRVPAAAYFFFLLAAEVRSAPLTAYALAFVPAYLALVDLRASAGRAVRSGPARTPPVV
jgi:hypothetical protein